MVKPDGELVVVKVDRLDLAICFFAATVETLVPRRTTGVIYARHIWHTGTA